MHGLVLLSLSVGLGWSSKGEATAGHVLRVGKTSSCPCPVGRACEMLPNWDAKGSGQSRTTTLEQLDAIRLMQFSLALSVSKNYTLVEIPIPQDTTLMLWIHSPWMWTLLIPFWPRRFTGFIMCIFARIITISQCTNSSKCISFPAVPGDEH